MIFIAGEIYTEESNIEELTKRFDFVKVSEGKWSGGGMLALGGKCDEAELAKALKDTSIITSAGEIICDAPENKGFRYIFRIPGKAAGNGEWIKDVGSFVYHSEIFEEDEDFCIVLSALDEYAENHPEKQTRIGVVKANFMDLYTKL